jgi:hypothetical protein
MGASYRELHGRVPHNEQRFEEESLDDDAEIIAAGEKREVALEQLREAVAACGEADLTRDEILEVVHPLFTDDDVFIEGALFDHLEDGEATEVLRIIYRCLPEGGMLALSVARRSRSKILKLCDDADIAQGNVEISREKRSLRISVTKLQS